MFPLARIRDAIQCQHQQQRARKTTMRTSTTLLLSLIVVCVSVCASAIIDPHIQQRDSPSTACSCGAEENDIVEQLLVVLRTAGEQYDSLMQRFVRLTHEGALRSAILSVPVELSFLTGLVAAWVCVRLGASRARRRSSTDLQQTRKTLHQRTTQWKVAAKEATDLAALLQPQHEGGVVSGGAAALTVPAPVYDAADVSKSDARDTDTYRIIEKPAAYNNKPADNTAATVAAVDATAARDDGATIPAAPAAAGDAEQTCRQLQFEEDGLNEHALRSLIEDYNKILAEQGLAHKQVALAPAAPPSTPRAPTPLSAAAAGAAAWPQQRASPEHHSPAPAPSPTPSTSAVSADEVRRMQLRISQLEAQVRATSSATTAAPAAAPLPAGALYVTHKEMELVQENQSLRQQLQQLMVGGGAGPDGWVTTTRGGMGVEDMNPSQELWMPATSLAAAPWHTPLSGSKTGGILGGGGAQLTPIRVFGSGGGSARLTPASEGSVKTGHAPGSGGGLRGKGSAAATLPPLRAGSLAAGSAAGSPSSSGTPRERMAAVLHDSRTKIEALGLNLNVSCVVCCGW